MTVMPFLVPSPEEVAFAVGATTRWWLSAACRGAVGVDFDSDSGSPEAMAVCRACPVRVDCLADEVEYPIDWVLGFRAGLPATDRRRLVARAASVLNGRAQRAARVRAHRHRGLSIKTIAELQGISVRTVYRLLADGDDVAVELSQRRTG